MLNGFTWTVKKDFRIYYYMKYVLCIGHLL